MSNGVTQATVVSTSTSAPSRSQGTEQLALYALDGTPIALPQTGASVKLTGYAIGTAGPVAATDTLNQALAKLEKRVKDLEDA